MKINLIIDSGEVLGGYLNIDPFAQDKNDPLDRQIGDISNLDWAVDAGELEELRAINILEYWPGRDAEGILSGWVSKLAHGGRIIIGFTDIICIAKDVVSRKLDIHQTNDIVYGLQRQTWDNKKSCFTVNQVKTFLESLNLKIITIRLIKHDAIVIAERP